MNISYINANRQKRKQAWIPADTNLLVGWLFVSIFRSSCLSSWVLLRRLLLRLLLLLLLLIIGSSWRRLLLIFCSCILVSVILLIPTVICFLSPLLLLLRLITCSAIVLRVICSILTTAASILISFIVYGCCCFLWLRRNFCSFFCPFLFTDITGFCSCFLFLTGICRAGTIILTITIRISSILIS